MKKKSNSKTEWIKIKLFNYIKELHHPGTEKRAIILWAFNCLALPFLYLVITGLVIIPFGFLVDIEINRQILPVVWSVGFWYAALSLLILTPYYFYKLFIKELKASDKRRKEFREDAREQKEWAKQRNALNHSMKKSISDMSTAEYLEMRRKKSLRNALIIAFVIFLITMWITNSIVMMRI